jgi:hypothetical protein
MPFELFPDAPKFMEKYGASGMMEELMLTELTPCELWRTHARARISELERLLIVIGTIATAFIVIYREFATSSMLPLSFVINRFIPPFSFTVFIVLTSWYLYDCHQYSRAYHLDHWSTWIEYAAVGILTLLTSFILAVALYFWGTGDGARFSVDSKINLLLFIWAYACCVFWKWWTMRRLIRDFPAILEEFMSERRTGESTIYKEFTPRENNSEMLSSTTQS